MSFFSHVLLMTSETSVAFLDGLYANAVERNWVKVGLSVAAILVAGKFLLSTVGSLPLISPLLQLLGASVVVAWLASKRGGPAKEEERRL